MWVVHVTVCPALPVPHTGSAGWSAWQVLVLACRCSPFPVVQSFGGGFLQPETWPWVVVDVGTWPVGHEWLPPWQVLVLAWRCWPFPGLQSWTTLQSASWSIHAPLHFLSV